jgi:PAS domain S-box-containing protein
MDMFESVYKKLTSNDPRIREIFDTAKTGVELSEAIRETVLVLQRISSGDPDARITKTTEIKMIGLLYQAINNTASDLGDMVNQIQELAIDLCECFDVLRRASEGDLQVSVSYASSQELTIALAKSINKLIKAFSGQIAERKLAEGIALRKGIEASAILNGTGDAIMVIDRDYCISKANAAMERITSRPVSELVGKKCYEVFPGSECNTDKCYLKQLMVDKKNIQLETSRKDIFEIDIPVEVLATPYEVQGKLLGVIESFRDNTDRRRIMENLLIAKEELDAKAKDLEMTLKISESLRDDLEISRKQAERSAKAKANFLANMSHEIRTPMNAILGFSDLIKSTELTDTQREYLRTITTSGDHLLGLINDILDFSKFEAEKITLEEIDFNLKYLIEDVLKIAVMKMERMEEKENDKISHFFKLDEDVPILLKGDPTRLRQVIINLLGNALKFTKEGSVGLLVRKDVSDKELDDRVTLRFSVKDTGIGIAQDKLDTVFQTFTQADESTTRKFGGTGLGLSISKTIVEMMGGQIWVEAVQGEGSEFIFVVTMKKGEDGEQKESVQGRLISDRQLLDEGAYKGIRVLIVEDNKTNQMLIKAIMGKLGCEIDVAENGAVAVDKLREGGEFDLVLMDLQMPVMGGVDAAKIISSEISKELPIVALSAAVLEEDMRAAKESGMVDFIQKPIDVSKLKEILMKYGRK